MIQIINDPVHIGKLQKQFSINLNKVLSTSVNCWIGHPGGNFQGNVRHSSEQNIWVAHLKVKNRYWNGFGIGKPIEGKNNSLVGEINFPDFGINRQIAGAFGIDENNKILVLHRGKIGGGSPGVGKNLFIDNFKGNFVHAIEGSRETKFCFVAELDSPLFVKQVSTFIHEINNIKKLRKYGTDYDFAEFINYVYTDETSGISVSENNEPKITNRTHGIIVNALANEVRLHGFGVGNDRNRDLFAYKKGKIITLFEVKTSVSTQCLYSAVGQLLIYTIPIKDKHKLVAVFPHKLKLAVEEQFKNLGIEILYYDWNDAEPIFLNLKQYL